MTQVSYTEGQQIPKIRHSNLIQFPKYSLQCTAKSECHKLPQNPHWHKIQLTEHLITISQQEQNALKSRSSLLPPSGSSCKTVMLTDFSEVFLSPAKIIVR
jgi:hypothetical protein